MQQSEYKRHFHFTLGPVQGFVAQARRTRDFWAGSFLLSYLAGVAMLEVKAQKGEIIFPKPDDNYLDWIKAGTGSKDTDQTDKPQHGGIPNRFLAKIPDGFSPSKVEKAVKAAWHEIAEQVWRGDLQPLLKQNSFEEKPIRDLWIRQIDGFWDVSWAIVKDEKETDILDRRKNWRSHYLQPEPGQKCMVMDGMQALCGTERPGEGRAFWDGLRKSGKRGIQTDLREGERLCAIAYVKRRFVHYFGDHFQAEMPEKWYANGWKLEPNAVSVVALAAKPWLENAEKNPAAQTTLREFYNAARVLSGESETTTEDYDWPSVEELAFYEADLRSSKLYPDREQAGRTLQALVALQQAAGLGAPSPYYALLLMDGDSLGKHMGKPTKRGLISEALNLFTSQAQEIVEQNRSGFLVYAGGDDVLALLALDDALPCAVALRSAYEAAFNQAKANAEARGEPAVEEFPATISAAIQFAHYRLPFTKILGDAHQLLDEVAKDGRGRDALAVRVWKLSGLHLTWAQPWDVALVEQGSGATANPDGQVWLAKLACALSTRPLDTVRPDPVEGRVSTGSTRTEAVDSKAGLDVANGFFYRLRERFALLKPKDSQAEGIEEEDMVKLMAYEYRHSGIHEGKMTQHDAEDLIKPLLQQCQPKYREEAKDSKPPQFKFTFEPDKPKRHQADAALLVRFLASHGNER